MKKIYIAADHVGVSVKEHIKTILTRLKVPFEDLGVDDPKVACDYPEIAAKLGKKVVKNKTKGILICGSGTGMVIAANKVRGVRAAIGYDAYSAKMSRHDNDANVLGLRARNFPNRKYSPILRAWFKTRFAGAARHKRRLKKVAALERR